MFKNVLTAMLAASIVSVSASAAMASSYPIAFVSKGHILRGENFNSDKGGVFTVSNGRVSCSGRYSWESNAASMSVPFRCTDGRTGVTAAARDVTPDGEVTYSTGVGSFSMSDGSKGAFYWGDAASGYMR